jgi:uncharacterized protein YneF (UPF0154 family)
LASKRLLEFVEYLNDYIIFTLPINLVEILAAIAGTIYLKKVPAYNLSTKHFVWFLWFTVGLETVGTIAPIAFFEDYNFFYFLKGTPFQDNRWVYNIYSLCSAAFLTFYFSELIKNVFWKSVLKYLIIFFVITSIINLMISGVFFTEDSKYVNLLGAFMTFFSITLFYFELLRSDLLLNLKRYFPLYVSIGVLVFSLCMTPLSIFSDYFNEENEQFVRLQSHLILYANLFMYLFFIIGFYICRKKSSS